MRVSKWKRNVVVGLMLLLTTGVAVMATLGAVYLGVGRTPSELIDYTKRRLYGHTRLEAVSLPVLNALSGWLGEPDAAEQALPFVVPPLPPRPPAAAVLGAAESGDPMRIWVGATRKVTSLAVAASLAPDGAVIEVDPGDYLGDVAIWNQKVLTIRGTGPGVRLIAGGRSAEGKAIWVLRGGVFLVENIAFIGARVPDKNGAGIRLEGGDLTLRNCLFWDNETGILTTSGDQIRLTVENSEFGYLGKGDGQSHGIYVGSIGYFRLSGSYVHHVNVGHLVKSRAQVNRIEYNRLSDETGGRASYELEFPNGGDATVVGNVIQQGSGTRNSVMVSYGVEGYSWPVNRLTMNHNTLVNDRRYGGTFLRVTPGAQAASIRNNLLVGPGKVDAGPSADEAGQVRADWEVFVQPSREDYRLTAAARAEMGAQKLASLPESLQPKQEYRHPLMSIPLREPVRFPGAFQSAAP